MRIIDARNLPVGTQVVEVDCRTATPFDSFGVSDCHEVTTPRLSYEQDEERRPIRVNGEKVLRPEVAGTIWLKKIGANDKTEKFRADIPIGSLGVEVPEFETTAPGRREKVRQSNWSALFRAEDANVLRELIDETGRCRDLKAYFKLAGFK